MKKLIEKFLHAGAEGAAKLATVVAPTRAVDVFLTRMWAAGRPWWHLDAYRANVGCARLEFGGWTIEATWQS